MKWHNTCLFILLHPKKVENNSKRKPQTDVIKNKEYKIGISEATVRFEKSESFLKNCLSSLVPLRNTSFYE